ncbi:MAG: glycosyltransferase [Elusimicrobiota bacterium]|nr:glycosyltransferase [Elusimicrobiota bacterium]
MKRLHLIADDNGRGLSRNIVLLRALLEGAGWEVTVTGEPRLSLPRRVVLAVRAAVSRPRFDANLFMESVVPGWLPHARRNLLLPNQEWFREKGLKHLARFDTVLCQTRHAEGIFKGLGCQTAYTSFTSMDRRLPGAKSDPRRVLHLGGHAQRGTAAVLAAWAARPDWPELTVVQREPHAGPLPPNARVLTGLSDAALRELQNACGIHLQPSRAEGFGHSIVEGLSCGAVVVTTDAPPMNEVVTAERGLLAAWKSSEPMRLGTAYDADPAALSARVDQALSLDAPARARLGDAARSWFEANDRFFRRRFLELLP